LYGIENNYIVLFAVSLIRGIQNDCNSCKLHTLSISYTIGVKSWSFPASAVELTSGGIDTQQYAENDEWKMTSSEVTKQNVTVGGVEHR
jgi:hypothetical protein